MGSNLWQDSYSLRESKTGFGTWKLALRFGTQKLALSMCSPTLGNETISVLGGQPLFPHRPFTCPDHISQAEGQGQRASILPCEECKFPTRDGERAHYQEVFPPQAASENHLLMWPGNAGWDLNKGAAKSWPTSGTCVNVCRSKSDPHNYLDLIQARSARQPEPGLRGMLAASSLFPRARLLNLQLSAAPNPHHQNFTSSSSRKPPPRLGEVPHAVLTSRALLRNTPAGGFLLTHSTFSQDVREPGVHCLFVKSTGFQV